MIPFPARLRGFVSRCFLGPGPDLSRVYRLTLGHTSGLDVVSSGLTPEVRQSPGEETGRGYVIVVHDPDSTWVPIRGNRVSRILDLSRTLLPPSSPVDPVEKKRVWVGRLVLTFSGRDSIHFPDTVVDPYRTKQVKSLCDGYPLHSYRCTIEGRTPTTMKL